jgi:hypothetical protein
MPSKKRLVIRVAQTIVLCALGVGAYYYTRDVLANVQDDSSTVRWGDFAADPHDITAAMDRIACEQTALFIMEHMPTLKMSANRFVLMNHSLKSVGAKGMYCEFGVAGGHSINYIAKRIPGTIHGFDSFEGNPDDWQPHCQKGAYAQPSLPKVLANVKLHKGWFNESLPVWAKNNPGPIAFMHLDADLYSSTKTVFDILGDRIVPGTVIQFDEYFNYPSWQQGEHKAFQEFVKSRQVEFEYLGYSAPYQVSVRIVSIGKGPGTEPGKGVGAALRGAAIR